MRSQASPPTENPVRTELRRVRLDAAAYNEVYPGLEHLPAAERAQRMELFRRSREPVPEFLAPVVIAVEAAMLPAPVAHMAGACIARESHRDRPGHRRARSTRAGPDGDSDEGEPAEGRSTQPLRARLRRLLFGARSVGS
jgi:hypothetical protein